MKHTEAAEFVVNQPAENERSRYLSDAIKRLEPLTRANGQTIDWDKTNTTYLPTDDKDVIFDNYCPVKPDLKD